MQFKVKQDSERVSRKKTRMRPEKKTLTLSELLATLTMRDWDELTPQQRLDYQKKMDENYEPIT